MRKRTEAAWKRCPKCGKIKEQVKAGYNGAGSQCCKCKKCGIYYTIDPKRHEYPEETRKLVIKMYYGGMSGCGVGKIPGMNKSNVMNWIKKASRAKDESASAAGAKIVELDELDWYLEQKSWTEIWENVYVMTMVSREPRQLTDHAVRRDKSSGTIQHPQLRMTPSQQKASLLICAIISRRWHGEADVFPGSWRTSRGFYSLFFI